MEVMELKTIREWFQLIDTSLNYLKEQVLACTEDGMDDVCYDHTVDSDDIRYTRYCASDVINNITDMLNDIEKGFENVS